MPDPIDTPQPPRTLRVILEGDLAAFIATIPFPDGCPKPVPEVVTVGLTETTMLHFSGGYEPVAHVIDGTPVNVLKALGWCAEHWCMVHKVEMPSTGAGVHPLRWWILSNMNLREAAKHAADLVIAAQMLAVSDERPR